MTLSEILHVDKSGRVVPNWRLHLQKFYLALIITLVSTLAFGLGRLSVGERRGGVSIEYDTNLSDSTHAPTSTATQTTSVVSSSETVSTPQSLVEVVASKNGTKYHYTYCPGAKQIKEANRIHFKSPIEAESAGYTIAGNCKPK